MNHDARPWWPKSTIQINGLARRLKDAGGNEFFVFLVIAAAGGEWGIFEQAVVEVCGLDSMEVRKLLDDVRASPDWSSAYSNLQLPAALFPYFIAVIAIGQSILKETPEVGASRRLRALVLKKAQLAAGIASRAIGDELRTRLYE